MVRKDRYRQGYNMNKFGCLDYNIGLDDAAVADDQAEAGLTVTQIAEQTGLDFSDVARDWQD